MKSKCVFNWSGGKDSTLALHHLLQDDELDIQYLLTTINDSLNRVAMHGVREELLIKQAESIGIPLYQVRLPEMPGMDAYDKAMHHHLTHLHQEEITHAIYGDIFLEDLRTYRESKLSEVGLKPIFPLWKQDTKALLKEFIGLGYKTVIVCAQKGLEHFCGRVIDEHFLEELPEGIDPCGENGEFHTFVFDGPIFKQPIAYQTGEKVYKTFETAEVKDAGYWYIDLIPA